MIKINIQLLINEFNEIKKLGWIRPGDQGFGSVGLLFERLLGVNRNKFSFSDYFGIEIKTKYSKVEEYLTLFSINPVSDQDYTIKYLVDNYGYPDKKNPTANVFQTNINALYYKEHRRFKFKLSVDEKEEKIHLNIYNRYGVLIDNKIYWKFKDIEERLNDKCKQLAFIQADRVFMYGQKKVRYTNLQIYEYVDFTKFIKAIKNGYIRVCFKVGVRRSGEYEGAIYNHGTSFEIKHYNLQKIFNRIY